MSYCRYGHAHKYVEGESDDYIFGGENGIEDYRSITDETLIEIICDVFYGRRNDDKMIKEYLIKKLSERLGVKMRQRPLTDDEMFDMWFEDCKKMDKEIENYKEEHKDEIPNYEPRLYGLVGNVKLNIEGARKPKHTAGKTKKSKCSIKQSGGKCACGSYGKKLMKLPEPYKDDPIARRNSRKWKKKHGIEIVKKAKEMFEDD